MDQPETIPEDLGSHSFLAGRYRVDEEIARGGMGTVYRVFDIQTGETRALKRLMQPATDDMRAQFEREFRTLAGLHHPRIIEVFDYGVDRGEPYYTMELLDGQDLRELAPLPFGDAVRHLRDVATSLALLHTRRLLHRDIKPANIRITSDGRCKLLDFGALTPFGTPERIVGTAPYLPPEALSRSPLDQRADVYAFGALCYWMLTRKHAYRAKGFKELPELWRKRAQPPSKYEASIPRGVDQLILSLIDPDPMARPQSMAEVVELLNRIGNLAPEDAETQAALGESYLATTHFVGRREEMAVLERAITSLAEGSGQAVLLQGPGGVGRTRLIDELDLRARMAEVTTVHVDAAMHTRARGVIVAAAIQLTEQSDTARLVGSRLEGTLRGLDPLLDRLLGTQRTTMDGSRPQVQEALLGVLTAACEGRPVAILIDNADAADPASLRLLQGAMHLVGEHRLSLVLASRTIAEGERPVWDALRASCQTVNLHPLSEEETLTLTETLFGEAKNRVRFAQWLHERSGGLPLHYVELVRQLHAAGAIRFEDGLWQLPSERPDTAVPERLEALVERQLQALSPEARALAEEVAIQRGRVARTEEARASVVSGDNRYGTIEELLQRNVLSETVDGYSLRNNALRDAVLRGMSDARRSELHRQRAEEVLAEDQGQVLTHAARIEAGRHFLAAGDEDRGADLLAAVAYDSIGVRLSFADFQVVAPALESALEIFTRQGRNLYERAPLLIALAQAGYYEHRRWADKYGDAAIEAAEEVTGLKTARRLRRFFGRTIGLVLGLLLAVLRYRRAPRATRHCSFRDLMVQLMGLVTTLVGVASTALDVERARKVASVLDPFMHLPERLTPVGIGQFCRSLCEVGRDNPADAMARWEVLLGRFDDLRYYPTLPVEARPLYIGGLWFARGVFEAFRDGPGALRCADELDALGMKMYRLIASELRALHYLCRGDLENFRRHTEELEMHTVELGSASQVELWEAAAQLPPYSMMFDLVGLRQVSQRLAKLAETHPSLARYTDFSVLALEHAGAARLGDSGALEHGEQFALHTSQAKDILMQASPREFIGWGTVAGQLSHSLNMVGHFSEARDVTERILQHITDADRDYVALFLSCELESAVAEAGLGGLRAATEKLDALLLRHQGSDNPLTRGRIHDAYARVGKIAGRQDLFQHHLSAARSYYRSTTSTALAAHTEVLASLWRRSERPTS